jgi:hypothetical protein
MLAVLVQGQGRGNSLFYPIMLRPELLKSIKYSEQLQNFSDIINNITKIKPKFK